MHLKRILTALTIFLFLVFLLVRAPVVYISIFVACISVIALFEYHNIIIKKEEAKTLTHHLFFIFTALVSFFMLILTATYSFDAIILALVFYFILSSLLFIFSYKQNKITISFFAKQCLGMVYIPVSLSYLCLNMNSSYDKFWIFFIVLIVAANDTGAYYIGTYFGKTKLSPLISPNKTYEGFFGGMALSLLTGLIYKSFALTGISFLKSILFIIIISFIATMGDLFESVLKRDAEVKDSGKLLPGHGGILDRIDGLLFACPIFYLFKYYIF